MNYTFWKVTTLSPIYIWWISDCPELSGQWTIKLKPGTFVPVCSLQKKTAWLASFIEHCSCNWKQILHATVCDDHYCVTVLLRQFRSVLVFLLKNVDIRGIELLKWDTAHPTVRSSSPEVSWCSCFIQWVNTGPVSSFGLFIFTIFWFRRAASSARLGVICLHSHQQMESEMFRLFLQAPLNVLHLLNQIWMWCFFVLNDPFKLL